MWWGGSGYPGAFKPWESMLRVKGTLSLGLPRVKGTGLKIWQGLRVDPRLTLVPPYCINEVNTQEGLISLLSMVQVKQDAIIPTSQLSHAHQRDLLVPTSHPICYPFGPLIRHDQDETRAHACSLHNFWGVMLHGSAMRSSSYCTTLINSAVTHPAWL